LTKHLPKILAGLIGIAVIAGGAYVLTRKSPEDHYRAGVELHQKGNLKGAAIELKNLLQSTPNNGDARLLLGRIHFAQGDMPAAEKELQKARELGVKDPQLEPLYANTLLLLNQPKRVIDEIKEQEGAGADSNAAILALRARAQLFLNDPAAADAELAQADTRSDSHPEALASRAYLALSRKDPQQALDFVEQAIAKADQRADLWIMKGDLLRTLKRNAEALPAYAKASAIDPANVPARLAIAQLHLENAALDKAEAELKVLAKYAPNNLMGRYMTAYIEFRRGRYQEADAKLQDVLRTSANFLPAHLLSGAVKLALGNREAAKQHLDKILGVAPQHPLARKLMAAALAEMGDVAEARKLLESFGDAGNDPILNAMQGELALHQGDYAQARKHLESLDKDVQLSAKQFTELAASRMGTGDQAGAIEALSKAAELDTESARPDVLLVLAHLKEKRFDAALQVVAKLDKERPNDPVVHNLRGTINISRNDKAQARGNFADALKANPVYFPAASNLALLDIMDKNVDAARARFDQLLKKAPKETRAWLALAALDAQQKNEAGYLRNLEQAQKSDAKNVQAHLLLARYWLDKRIPGKALSVAREGLDATGRPEFHEFIGLAQLQQNDPVNALAAFKRWAEASPGNPMAHYRLSQAQAMNKDRDGALKSLDQAIALRPDFVDASKSKAQLLGQMGRSREALQIARQLQSSKPKSASGFLAEAEILYSEKNYLEAGKLYVKASQVSGLGQPLANAYQAYARAGQAAEGEKLMQQWLARNPADAALRHQLALAQLNAKRLQDAADNYRILVKNNPQDVVAYNNLAWLLGELNAPDALAVAEQAYKLSPEIPGVQDTLGWILVNSNQAKRGLELLKKAFAKAPGSPDIHWHLAVGYVKAGDPANALANLELLLSKNQDFYNKQDAIKLFNQLKQGNR
jgi:putative PEP-CTERM system TPR-repeat lipoprotein